MIDAERIAERLSALAGGRAHPPRIDQTAGRVTVVIDATGMALAARQSLETEVKAALSSEPGVADVRVAITAERTARRIIAVGSGKGGVGKSTLAVNLAVALHRAGMAVGLVDADIHGPSLPRLLGDGAGRPVARDGKLVPVENAWGVPMLSTGQIAEAGQAIAWRGPMVGRALDQLIDAHWDGIDTLVVDLPPGTGDIQLTMIQKHRPTGAVIVSTPQDLALIDATRALDLFAQVHVPVIGLVENMAGYACPHCGVVSDPFGSGGAEATAARLNLPFLGRIPLTAAIRSASDAGTPPAASDDAHAVAFAAIAARVADWLEARKQGK